MSRLTDRRRRPPRWRVRTTVDGQVVILYAGPRMADIRPHLSAAMDGTGPQVIVTRNGHRVWPQGEQLTLD